MPTPDAAGAYFTAEREGEALQLALRGEWRATQLPAIQAQLATLDLTSTRSIRIVTGDLATLDLSGAWVLREYIRRARQADHEVRFEGEEPDTLRLIEECLDSARARPVPSDETQIALEPVEALGRQVVRRWGDVLAGLTFLGLTSARLGSALGSFKRLRPIAVARQIYDTGITAVPIVALIAFLISVIIAYMSAQQLQKFGAEVFVVDLVTIGVLRELGVLLTAIIVAGRSGSAFAAEIGAMELNEEVDALRATGVDPHEVLVSPRVVGLVIALPLLTMLADLVGLTGGALLCRVLIDMPLTQYLGRVNESISATTFWVGIIKAPVFAVLIAMAGTYRGMQVRGSSRELGRLTTVAVVQSIFLVILADALFAVLFMEMGI